MFYDSRQKNLSIKLAPFAGKVFKPTDDSGLHFPASRKRRDFSDGTVTQYHSTHYQAPSQRIQRIKVYGTLNRGGPY